MFTFFGHVQGQTQEQTEFVLQAPREVYAGEAFDVAFVVNSKGSKDFRAPDFKGFDVLFGPSQSQSSSFQFINGQQSQSFSLSFAYRLRAPKEGSYNLGSAYITVNEKKYSTEKISIRALPSRSSGNSQSNQRSQQGRKPQGSDKNENISDKDLFIRAFVSKHDAYIGEEIDVTYRLYTAVQVRQYSISKLPSNKGFWSEELSLPESEQSETIDGRRYIYVDIRKLALFPQEAGRLTIEPLEIETIAAITQKRERSGNIFDIFDDPFFDQVSYVKKNVKSKAISINVTPLPEEGKPTDFNGLVGDFNISFGYDKNKEPRANDAITFSLKVAGTGNIELIQAPSILFPPDFEVYEPRISNTKNTSSDHIKGTATMEYIAVPRTPGVYRIPSFQLSFFNPKIRSYKTITIPETVLNVKEGDGSTYQGTNSSDAANLSSATTLAALQTHQPVLKAPGQIFFLGLWWWAIAIAIPLLFVTLLGLRKYRIKARQDVIGLLNKRALREAKRCLRKAHTFMSQHKKDEFYVEISQALWGFISHKFNVHVSDLSVQNVENTLSSNGISSKTICDFAKTLTNCEFERFAPQGNSEQSMEHIYNEALNVISQIVNELKK